MRAQKTALLLITLTACAADSQNPNPPPIQLPPGGGVPAHGTTPGGPSTPLPLKFSGGGAFAFSGATTPGTATFSMATYVDADNRIPPSNVWGTGTMNIAVDGTAYTSSGLQTLLWKFTETGTEYIAFDGITNFTDPSGTVYDREITVYTKKSDFAPGATVALDGTDRVAIFGTGPDASNETTTAAAAVTGTVTFGTGTLANGGTVSGSVQGDFGEIQWVPPGATILPGNYSLAIAGSSTVTCQGTLAGHEADFAGITIADLGVGGGAVTVSTPSEPIVNVAGAPISSGFGSATLELDEQSDQAGLYAGFAMASGSGPDGTQFLGKYLAFDGSTASTTLVLGSAGGDYVTADRNGYCEVSFPAQLTQP